MSGANDNHRAARAPNYFGADEILVRFRIDSIFPAEFLSLGQLNGFDIMRRWYQATCVVRLPAPASIEDGTGENGAVTGYVVNIGLSGDDLMQAMTEAERVALRKFDGRRDGNRLEEVKIKEVELPALQDQFPIQEAGSNGNPIFVSKLIYFDE